VFESLSRAGGRAQAISTLPYAPFKEVVGFEMKLKPTASRIAARLSVTANLRRCVTFLPICSIVRLQAIDVKCTSKAVPVWTTHEHLEHSHKQISVHTPR